MKVQLTDRRHVEAAGKWFRAKVTETHVTVNTEFGSVRIARTRKGLEVSIEGNTADIFLEHSVGSNLPAYNFTDGHVDTTLRLYGQVQLGEMDDPTLRAGVEKWMKKG